MLDYKVKIGLVAMRRNATNRPRGTFLTWYSAEERGRRFTDYIEANFTSESLSFVGAKDLYLAFQSIGSGTYEYMVPYLAMAIIYIIIVCLITLLIKVMERRLRKSDRGR